jgi:Uma2 family endonuclease
MLRTPSYSGTLETDPVKETRMSTVELPRLPMTADEFGRMPPVKGLRIELWEGNLDVSAAAQMRWHALVMHSIGDLFKATGQEISYETGVVLTDRTVREPDVSRFRRGVFPGYRRSQFSADDVDCVVEVISPESERRDREIKPEEYAKAGIPELWLVEEHPDDEADAIVNVYRLEPAGVYALTRKVALSALTDELEQEIER